MVEPDKYYEDKFHNNFPVDSPRDKQKPAVKAAFKEFDNGADVVQIDAPPGLGKSFINYTVAQGMTGDVFYVTPLNTLVDQLEEDKNLEPWIMTMKGRKHYECISDFAPPGVSVDKAPCQKQSNFDCPIKEDCLYYGRKKSAMDHPFVVTNMSYLMADSMMPDDASQFEDRDILIVDEAQNIDDFALDFVSFTISKKTVPNDVWKNMTVPHEKYEEDEDKLIEWVDEEVSSAVKEGIRKRQSKDRKSDQDLNELEQLTQFNSRIEKFIQDRINHDWIAQIDWAGPASDNNRIMFKPITVGRFLHELLWGRADKIILSSATIPKGDWLKEVGLDQANVHRLNIGSLFPVEHRPIITSHAIGKMTYNKRDENAPKMARKIKEIAEYHEGEKGLVHCRSYGMMEQIQNAFYDNGDRKWFHENVKTQNRMDREGSLNKWRNGDTQLFFSVNMSEGISLDGDDCRFQILAKVLYPFMGDKRTKYRIQERDDWDWYNNQAAIQLEQAYGRAVRSVDDYASFYLLDESATGLIDRNKHLFHDWFLEAMVETDNAGIITDLKPRVLSDQNFTSGGISSGADVDW